MGTATHPGSRLRADISTVLKKREQGSCKEYDIMLNALAEPNTETSLLTTYLYQLRDCVSFISREHEQLVGIILGMDWLNKDPALIQEYKRLLLNLVSAHPFYLRAVVRMLIKEFYPKSVSRTKKTSGSEKPPDQATRNSDALHVTHVHELLKAVALIVPTTNTVIMQLMKDNFPYYTRCVYTHEVFSQNMLKLIQYMPVLRPQILELLIEKMLQLDVRASRNDIVEAEESSDEEDEEENCDMTEVFQMEGIEEDGKKEILAEAEEEEESSAMNHEEAQRLDILMDITLSYIHSTCHPNGELDWNTTKALYRELLAVFDRFIISTHASSHVQFLLFYIVSFRKDLLVGFLDYLWKKITTALTENAYRQAAAGYLGSLLARAVYVPISSVKEVVKLMTDWLHDYINQTGNDIHADLTHHAPFYAVCQAVFYVFSFRNQQLLELKNGHKWAESLGFQRLVNSRLNPMKVCLPLVCTTFASVTRMHQLALCDTVIQRNSRSKQTSDPSLEAFFPFDPYLLKRSGRWIKPLYREYDGSLPDARNESDDEDEDDFLPDEDMDASLGACSSWASSSKLDFLKYSSSPGFKL